MLNVASFIFIILNFSCTNHENDLRIKSFVVEKSLEQTSKFDLEGNNNFEIVKLELINDKTFVKIRSNFPCYYCCEKLTGGLIENEKSCTLYVEFESTFTSKDTEIVQLGNCTFDMTYEIKGEIPKISEFEVRIRKM